MNTRIDRQSSVEEKRAVAAAAYENLGDTIFDRLNLMTLEFSQVNDAGGTTDQTNYATDSRLIDSSAGKRFNVGRESRFRCGFYLENQSKLDGYILSPATYNSISLGTVTSVPDKLESYFGLKFLAGVVSIVSKERGSTEKLYDIDFELDAGSFTQTYSLDIFHKINYAEVLINNVSFGSFTNNLGNGGGMEVFYPFFAPARSTDGTEVNIALEGIQFIQSR